MANTPNINDYSKLINLYIDKALSEEDESVLKFQISNDPVCSKMYNKEKHFREMISNNIKRPTVTGDLIQKIKRNVEF